MKDGLQKERKCRIENRKERDIMYLMISTQTLNFRLLVSSDHFNDIVWNERK